MQYSKQSVATVTARLAMHKGRRKGKNFVQITDRTALIFSEKAQSLITVMMISFEINFDKLTKSNKN